LPALAGCAAMTTAYPFSAGGRCPILRFPAPVVLPLFPDPKKRRTKFPLSGPGVAYLRASALGGEATPADRLSGADVNRHV
jgi:hypothetical protein